MIIFEILLKSLLFLILLLGFLCLIPIGVKITSDGDGFDARLKFWLFSFSVFSQKKKNPETAKEEEEKNEKTKKSTKSKTEKKKKSEEKKKKTPQKKQGEKKVKKKTDKSKNKYSALAETIALAQQFIPVVLFAMNTLGEKKRIQKLVLELVIGSEDPVEATMLYGQAHALLGTLWIPLDEALNIEEGHARVVLEFEETQPAIYGVFIFTITIGQILAIALRLGFSSYQILQKSPSSKKKKKSKKKSLVDSNIEKTA